MAAEPESPVDLAIEAIASGREPDWSALRQLDASADDQRLLEELALIRAAVTPLSPLGVGADDTIGVTAPDGAAAERWGALEITETIGQGSHGAVFRAWDTRLARMVALKLVRVDDGQADEALREARLLARLSHPNIVTVHGADRQGATVGWWMQLIDGCTLEQVLEADGPRSPEEAVVIGLAVGRAAAAVHRAGLVHNDIKPNNIMRETGGRIVLMDFSTGRAMHQQSGPSPAGTPLYMAPELFAGAAPSAQSDVYSLGVVLFRLATGEYPVNGSTFEEVRRAHESRQGERLAASRPELPAAFAAALDRALSPDPGDRYQTAEAFVQALSATIAPRPARRAWPLALAGSVFGISLLVYALLGTPRSTPTDSAAPAGPTAEVVNQTLAIWHGYEDLALEHAARGDYVAAAASFTDAIRAASTIFREESPLIGWTFAKRGWMLAQAGGDQTEALRQLQVGLHTLQQPAGADHPYRATTFISYAASLQQAGRYADALEAVSEALAIRQHFLGLSAAAPSEVWAATGLDPARLTAAIPHTSVALDSDDDGLADVAEIALGLDPNSATTHPPQRDGDADVDRDGWSDRLELGWDWDPSRVIAHYGPVDPGLLGFVKIRDFRASPASDAGAPNAGWRIVAGSLGHYKMLLSPRLKRDAAAEFVLTARSRVESGMAYVGLDLVPVGPRFDMDSHLKRDGRRLIKTNTAIVPPAGPEYPVPENARPLLQMAYTRALGARLSIDGVAQSGWYGGHRAYQEDEGLFFGAFNRFGEVPSGAAVFELIHLVVKEPSRPAAAIR